MADYYEMEPHELRRSFLLENGNILDIERVLGNGFWQIRYRHGTTPNVFRGQYTTFGIAFDAAKKHFSTMVRPHVIVREITNAA